MIFPDISAWMMTNANYASRPIFSFIAPMKRELTVNQRLVFANVLATASGATRRQSVADTFLHHQYRQLRKDLYVCLASLRRRPD
jgi:hypothetical protein